MKKRVIAILTTAVFAVSLAACGGQDQQSSSTSAKSESTAASSSSSAASSSSSSSAAAEEKKVGGWELADSLAGNLPDEAQQAFDKAMESYEGGSLTALDLLGTQVVSGTNYMILCESADPAGLKVAVVYEDLKGNSEITKVSDFDIGTYIRWI